MIRFYNTLTRQKEDFVPISPPAVGLYTCGPTVYDFAHIGNLRTFIFEDLLCRVLVYNNYQVLHVMNITDIEDKIIKRANQDGVEFTAITRRYTRAFQKDLDKLNIWPPQHLPKVTDHINEIIAFIKRLQEKGFAYRGNDGAVYFDISRWPDYGRLAGLKKQDLKKGGSGRVSADEYNRDEMGDFALWKVSGSGQEPSWDSPWGKGRPGWHIECSVLSMQYLGDHFDIHTGAVDLIFPHHTNEIAQSEAVSGQKFVNYWLEGEHLLVDGAKMSKSQGNYYTLREIEQHGFDPLAFRYLCLTTHYRSKLNFTWQSLGAAQAALTRLRRETLHFKLQIENLEKDLWQGKCAEYEQNFLAAVNNDLDLPRALGLTWDLIKSGYPARLKLPTLLEFDKVLGLGLEQVKAGVKTAKGQIPPQVRALVQEREKLRQKGRYAAADQLRVQIQAAGYEIEDGADGPQLYLAD